MKYKDLTPSKRREYHANWHREVRRKLIEFLGGKCEDCGFSDSRALQLDHVNGKGLREYKKYKGNNTRLYRDVIEGILPRKEYQLLCSNCNWIKRSERDETGNQYGLD